MIPPYPQRRRERDQWILAERQSIKPQDEVEKTRRELDPQHPYAFLVEDERSASGEVVPVATVFLTNRECPWRCLMCDLWRNTLTESVPRGAIPAQIDAALAQLPPARQIKLYNSGSFFDPKAIPPEDYGDIAARLRGFERVIVECHPALIDESCLRFCDWLSRQGNIQLEVAMGLETVQPQILAQLNKGMTLDQFRRAAAFLQRNDIALRAFILLKPPLMDEAEGLFWAERSLDFAFDCDAAVAALIPTRTGNGAMEALAARGEFAPPRISTLETALAYGIKLGRGRVFADLWDLQRFAACADCFPARAARLGEMNQRQAILPPVACRSCEEAT
jgi:radical SAM enzyme (TIGR01210 family)